SVSLLQQLVVGGAGNDSDFQFWNRFIIDDSTKRAGSKDIGSCVNNLAGLDHRGTKFIDDSGHIIAIDIADNEFRGSFVKQLCQRVSNMPATLERDCQAGQIISLPNKLTRRLNRAKHSTRSTW